MPDTLRWLSDADAQRLPMFGAPLRRRQFLASRWMAQQMAATRRGGDAADWRLIERDDGRRLLRATRGEVFASISHCGEHLACAISEQPIGVDLEVPRRPRDYEAIARIVFSPEECERLHGTDATTRESLFLLHWTLKEAHGKSLGEGLRPERARMLTARACGGGMAKARTWPVGRGSLALCGATVSNLDLSGLPVGAASSCWHFSPAASCAAA